jgi:hypothetical protein
VEGDACQRLVFFTRLRKRARKQRVTPVQTNPPRQIQIQTLDSSGGRIS